MIVFHLFCFVKMGVKVRNNFTLGSTTMTGKLNPPCSDNFRNRWYGPVYLFLWLDGVFMRGFELQLWSNATLIN